MSEAAVMELERAVEWLDREIERITGTPERKVELSEGEKVITRWGAKMIADENVPKNVIEITADTEQATSQLRKLDKQMRTLNQDMANSMVEFNKAMNRTMRKAMIKSTYRRSKQRWANPQSYHGPRGGRLTGR